MSEALDNLVELLDLETIEVNVYRGRHPAEARQRTFGGQVAAQALIAAGRTVEDKRVHSLHSYFLRPGDPTTPILYEVDRIRDGKSFTTRRVVADPARARDLQHAGELPQRRGQPGAPDRDARVAGPETVRPIHERVSDEWSDADEWFQRMHPIDQRFLGELPWSPNRDHEPRQQLWIRADGELGDDQLLHSAVITYASDMSLMDVTLKPHHVRWDDGSFMGASLDHCMWFHRPVRADQWLLYDTDSPIAHGARGLARGFLFSQAGELCVSLVQEGLTRVVDPAKRKPE